MENTLKMERDDEFFESYGYYPPLGLLYLESYLHQSYDCDIKILDCIVSEIGYKEIRRYISEEKPDIVGITSFTSVMYDLLKVASIIKEVSPETKVIVGGAHATIYPIETASLPNIDAVVIGDGEVTFAELVRKIALNTSIDGIKGIAFKINGNVVMTGNREYNKDLDSLPFPDRTKVPYQKYTCSIGREKVMTTVMSSRGCPFRCTFCNSPEKSYRVRSPQNIILELEKINKLGIKEVFFFDDLFNINKKRVLEICTLIKEKRLQLRWSFRGRINGIDEELVKALKESGCERIQFGIETGSDEEMKLLRKKLTTSEVRRVVSICSDLGITTTGSFMIGLPGDTIDKIKNRFRFAEGLGLDYVQYAVLIPYPYTEVYKEGIRRGFFGTDVWLEYAKKPQPDFIPPIWEEFVKRDELYRLLNKGFRSFYFRPKFIIKSFLNLSSFGELKKKVQGAIALLQ